jgi:hypothetical protein
MSREIQELRETITKLVPLLTGKGLAVTQRGSQAYVKTDARTKKPLVVNIPNISDNASPEFCEAIQGYIDHEVAHVLITDWHHYAGGPSPEELRDPKVRQFMQTHNIVEDTMIEREIVQIFPGSRKNIAKLRQEFVRTISEPAIRKHASDPKEQFKYLLVPLMRALAGHEEFIAQLDAGKYWDNPYCQGVIKGLKPTTLAALKTVSTTKETLWIARELHEILFPPTPPEPPAPPAPRSPPPPKAEKSKSEDKPDKKAGEGEGTGERDHTDKPEEGDKSEGKPEDDEEDDAAEPAAGEPDAHEPAEFGDADDAAEEPAPAAEADGDGDDESEPEEPADAEPELAPEDGDDEDEDSEPAPGADDEPGDAEDDEVDADEEGDYGEQDVDAAGEEDAGKVDEVDEDDDGTSGGGIGKSEQSEGMGKSMFDFEGDAFEGVDMQSAIGKRLTEEAITSLADSDYRVFTRDFDRIETAPLPEKIAERWIPDMEDKISSMVGRMQKDIERLMASQSHVIRQPGQRRGKLHAPSLFRVMQGDERVFTVKAEHKSKDTAVTLLIDNSGSMRGSKQKTAMFTGYALSTTLERVKIAHEVIGFTTGNYGNIPQALYDALEEEQEKSDVTFHRIEPLVLPVYKSFAEKIDSRVKGRIAYAANAQVGLSGNIDGECLQYAAQRLAKRTEKRKVMIVLSDGYPVGSMAPQHLKWVVEDLTKHGIECIGIGIESDAVRDYYPKSVVLHNVNDLPGQVMGELRQLLS